MNTKIPTLEEIRATEHMRNPISDGELQKSLARGNLLAYERASDAQLKARKEMLGERLAEQSMPVADVTRHVGANMLYAAVSFSASLWFGAMKLFDTFPRMGTWLADKGFLRDKLTNFPYVADIAVFEDKIMDMATSWAHDARGGSPKAAVKRYELLTEMLGFLEEYGFHRSSKVLAKFLDNYKSHPEKLTTKAVFGELLGALQTADAEAAARKGVKVTPSMATKVLEFFAKAEEIAKTAGDVVVRGKLKHTISEHMSYGIGDKTVSPQAISRRIFQTKMTPVVIGGAVLGAVGVGVFSMNMARERRALLSATDLTFIDQVQQQREDHLPKPKIASESVMHQQTLSPMKDVEIA